MSKTLKVVGASWLQTKISSYILGFLGILAVLALFAGQIERIQEDGNYTATVFYSDKTGYSIEFWGQSNELRSVAKGAARARFRPELASTGWALLEVETDGSYPDEVQAYAAGIVEGALTWYSIHTHLKNTIRAKCQDERVEKQCDKLRDALDKSVQGWQSHAAEQAAADPFWHHVSLYYTQVRGVFTGWKHGVEKNQREYETDVSDLYWLNSASEVDELQRKLNLSLGEPQVRVLPALSSAFLKIAPDPHDDGAKNIFLAQNAAGSYSSMSRIMKRYKLRYRSTAESPGGVSVAFSGYPGSVSSQDEWYVVRGAQHRLSVAGTALRNYNAALWRDVDVAEQLPIGPRVSAANLLARNVSSWGHILASSNSGTGCKQWVVVDHNRFDELHDATKIDAQSRPKEATLTETVDNTTRHTVVHRAGGGFQKGLVWLIEQVPGLTHSADLSDALLERTYLATYGLPHFKDVAEVTHTTTMAALHGDMFSEQDSPRAALFRREAVNATGAQSIIRLMRMTNGTAQHRASAHCAEPECLCAELAASFSAPGVRADLLEGFRRPYGVIDTKLVAGNSRTASLEVVAMSGPPFTEPIASRVATNKGNVASTYTDKFDDVAVLDGVEIRSLVKQRRQEEEERALQLLSRGAVKPFQWSGSDYAEEPHEGLPDIWSFGSFAPDWSW